MAFYLFFYASKVEVDFFVFERAASVREPQPFGSAYSLP
jgi:hypothetical protein